MSSKSRYRPNTRRYELNWPDDHELSGLQVTLRGMRLGELESLAGLTAVLDEAREDGDEKGTAEALTFLIERLGKVLVSWNRLDEDTLVEGDEESGDILPANADGLRELDLSEFEQILSAYMTAAAGVSGPLDDSSNGGAQSLAELPMTAP